MPRCSISDTAIACSLFCTALTYNYGAVRDWLAALLINSNENSGGLTDLDLTPFSLLAIQLASQHLGIKVKSLPEAREHSQFYDSIMSIQSPAEMQATIEVLAIERGKLVLETQSNFPPFEHCPFDLWPVDLMAVAKLRFPEHTFTYGVLESPLCHPPTPLPFASDPLVERILARCRETMTIPDVDWISAE